MCVIWVFSTDNVNPRSVKNRLAVLEQFFGGSGDDEIIGILNKVNFLLPFEGAFQQILHSVFEVTSRFLPQPFDQGLHCPRASHKAVTGNACRGNKLLAMQ